MDGFTEKKWFVYLGDHHEGPFSLSEIQGKMNYGQVSATNYVWAEGMADWTLMSEVQAFGSILGQPATKAPEPEPEPALVAEPMAIEATQVFEGGASLAPSGFSAVSVEPAVALEAVNAGPILSAARELHSDAEPEPGEVPPTSHKKALAGQFVKIGFLFMVLGGLGYAYNQGYLTPLLQSQTAKSLIDNAMNAADPILSKLGISPIPKLDDVSADEYQQLKDAAKASLTQSGPKIAVALSKGDYINPTFYVASNLPDGTILDIYLEGIPETLLNQLSFTAKTEVVITKKFGKTNPLRFAQGEGHALPRGQYDLFVVDPGMQPPTATPFLARMPVAVQPSALIGTSVPKDRRVIGMQQYFLGGFRDAMYTARLQQFHQTITAKAQQELTELKQVAMTLDGQLADTNKTFASLHRGRRPTARQKKAWNKFHAKWTSLSQQLGELFSKLTPESTGRDYFYGSLYLMSKQASDAINQLHSIQNSYFSGGAGGTWDPKAFGIQLGESQSGATTAEDLLKAKIDEVSKLPPGPGGLPAKPPGT